MINDEQTRLVQSSFMIIAQDALGFSSSFYERLFELAPQVRPLFKNNMQEQQDKLIKMLGLIINNLYDLNSISVEIARLAQRHASYGVKDEHYQIVTEALVRTIAEHSPEKPDIATLTAWQEVLQHLSREMVTA